MKNILTTPMLFVVGLAFAAPAAKALTYNDGDLIMGFHATGGTGSSSSYVVDLGPASQFASGSLVTGDPVQISIAGITADLAATFGSNWATRSDLYWSLSGTQKTPGGGITTSNTLYASGVPSGYAWARDNVSGQADPSNAMQSVGQTYAAGTHTTNDAVGIVQANSTTNSFASQSPDYSSTFSAYSYFDAFNFESSFANGTAGSALDLYKMVAATGGAVGTDSTRLGAFEFDPTASKLLFSSDPSDIPLQLAAVPEPATIGFGLAMLGACALSRGRARRRTPAAIAA